MKTEKLNKSNIMNNISNNQSIIGFNKLHNSN